MTFAIISGPMPEYIKWPFHGFCFTRFHWTHNQRVYLGFRKGKYRWGNRWWLPVIELFPYSMTKSRELRRLPPPRRSEA